MAKTGLYANIHKKRARIKAGSNEKMRTAGTKGRPTAAQFKKAAKTAKAELCNLTRWQLLTQSSQQKRPSRGETILIMKTECEGFLKQ